MMLKHSLNLIEESNDIENAVEEVLNDGIFTADLSSHDYVSTDEMGNAILSKII